MGSFRVGGLSKFESSLGVQFLRPFTIQKCCVHRAKSVELATVISQRL